MKLDDLTLWSWWSRFVKEFIRFVKQVIRIIWSLKPDDQASQNKWSQSSALRSKWSGWSSSWSQLIQLCETRFLSIRFMLMKITCMMTELVIIVPHVLTWLWETKSCKHKVILVSSDANSSEQFFRVSIVLETPPRCMESAHLQFSRIVICFNPANNMYNWWAHNATLEG